MNILIHSLSIKGHRLEYIHHFYQEALCNKHNNFIFALPKEFKEKSCILNWPNAENITIDFIRKTEQESYSGGIIKKSIYKAKNLGYYCKKYKIDRIILIDLMVYLPFLPIFVSRRCKVYGIIYRIYFYEWKKESIIKKIQDASIYFFLSKLKVFHKIFLLNDLTAANYANRLFNTKKFFYLPDPIPISDSSTNINIRKKYGISDDKIIILHPGGLLPYKGTLDILKAIKKMSADNLSKYVFIFAGRISTYIEKDYYQLLCEIGDKANIVEEKGFLPFDILESLFKGCDLVLIPYKTKTLSSGILGHAAYHSKPVIVGKGGVIGKIVKKFSLGYLMDAPDSDSIKIFLESNIPLKEIDGNNYVKINTVNNFIERFDL